MLMRIGLEILSNPLQTMLMLVTLTISKSGYWTTCMHLLALLKVVIYAFYGPTNKQWRMLSSGIL